MGRPIWFRTALPLIAIAAALFRPIPIESDDRTVPSVREDLEKLEALLPEPTPILQKFPEAYGFRGSPRVRRLPSSENGRPASRGPSEWRAASTRSSYRTPRASIRGP
jgi:hypothetical protein